MNLKDKVVLITGGAKRIGKVLVDNFAKHGAKVAFTYRSSKKEAESLAGQLKNDGVSVEFYKAE